MGFKLIGIIKHREIGVKFVGNFLGEIAYNVKEIE